jgi:uncharacterized membrane protein
MTIGIICIAVFLWMVYEIWRAPLTQETEDGKLITKRPTRKLKDLFKKNKKIGGSYSDLEKLGRGRSKH